MLTREMLYSLEQYRRIRPEFRAKTMAHKKRRFAPLGPNASLHFEDELTMHYRMQEVMRLARMFEPKSIQEELDACNSLIPDGANWKAMLMLKCLDFEEGENPQEPLIVFEKTVWMQVADFARIVPLPNDGLEFETEGTLEVRFLRFELTPEMVAAVKRGAPVLVGVDHPHYKVEQLLPQATRDSLAADLA